jgi:hypothetical protein
MPPGKRIGSPTACLGKERKGNHFTLEIWPDVTFPPVDSTISSAT